jgi:hypothetical protein
VPCERNRRRVFCTQGFTGAQLGTPSAYFPFGAAQCCTPTLLHASGDVRPLHRCDCQQDTLSPTHVSCGAAVRARSL